MAFRVVLTVVLLLMTASSVPTAETPKPPDTPNRCHVILVIDPDGCRNPPPESPTPTGRPSRGPLVR
jgi:hypothetical protein